jgi:hypothetical protein
VGNLREQIAAALYPESDFPRSRRAPTPLPPASDEVRHDGSRKANGFLGAIRRPDGGISTELSASEDVFGKRTDLPLMVPSLSHGELRQLLSLRDGEWPADSIYDKAKQHAAIRMATGRSPFADDNESPRSVRTPGPWSDSYVLPRR